MTRITSMFLAFVLASALAIALAGTAVASTGGAAAAVHPALSTTSVKAHVGQPATPAGVPRSLQMNRPPSGNVSTGSQVLDTVVMPGGWWVTWGWWYITIHLTYQETFYLYMVGYTAVFLVTDFACSKVPWPISTACSQAAGAITSVLWGGILWWGRNYFFCGVAVTYYFAGGQYYSLEC